MTSSHCYGLGELRDLGIRVLGTDVRVDRSVRFFGAENISLGNRVRIDCFGLLSAGPAGIAIGNNVHIAAGCYLFGADAAITLDDFTCLSSVVTLHASTDDFVQGFLTNPTVHFAFRNVTSAPIHLERHALIGSHSVVLPGVTLGYGAAVGACSLVRKSVPSLAVAQGNPCHILPMCRNRDLLQDLERQYLETLGPDVPPR
jgi:acetyltransferase-like isoleucine patch superfamily enzyme